MSPQFYKKASSLRIHELFLYIKQVLRYRVFLYIKTVLKYRISHPAGTEQPKGHFKRENIYNAFTAEGVLTEGCIESKFWLRIVKSNKIETTIHDDSMQLKVSS